MKRRWIRSVMLGVLLGDSRYKRPVHRESYQNNTYRRFRARRWMLPEPLKREVAKLIRRYRQGWRDVEALGAVIKDTRTGLVDFYGRVDNRVVCLCWRFGESAIDFYHEIDQGFSGRKPLADVRKRMLN